MSAIMVVATSGLTVAATGTPAAAHNALRASVPAAGATLSSSPAELVLTFSESPNADFTKLAVTDAAGITLTDGASAVSGVSLRQPLRPATVAGAVNISFRVVSDDGHPVQGRLNFAVTSVARPSASFSPQVPTQETASRPAASTVATAQDDRGRPPVPVSLWIGGAVFALAGCASVAWWSRRRAASR
ncbi:copper resistance CopC family protein [Actinoplanes sp. ATCC 53533]|uniref:copper resistance CopC family protein n=1 Tax=Actinoplanes sp. ATCC 53533 TaxID=1288362 RepID=UPI0013156C6D|nr:copper resistance CopC family protein [Actinoplanes sp. ATCC 53533]